MPTIRQLKGNTVVLSCFDRVIFHGHLTRLTSAKGVVGFAVRMGLRVAALIPLFGRWRQEIIEHAEKVARQRRRPVLRLTREHRKEDEVRRILRTSPARQGLVCVVVAQEPFWSFRFAGKKDAPRVVPDRRRGTAVYYYLIDRELGLIHVRVNTYAPYTAQVYVNAHEWLANQLRRARIRFTKQDNVFTHISQPQRAQEIADRFVRLDWPQILGALARRANPLLAGPLAEESYYWCVDQAEYATDLLFRSAADLQSVWEHLRLAAINAFNGEDVMTFFGRSAPRSSFEVVGDVRRRWQGFRLKHRLGRNSIKSYDKAGSVLRVETTINDPADFQIYRSDARRWTSVRKGVIDFSRVEDIARRANRRYLHALEKLDLPTADGRDLLRLQRPVQRAGRRTPGLRLLDDPLQDLFRALLDARVHLRGLTNADLRQALHHRPAADPLEERRRAQRLTRQLAKLRAHGLIRKLPHTRRWVPTTHGLELMAQAVTLRNSLWPNNLPVAA